MRAKRKILILLVEGFEEGEAGIAVSELREAGLPVKVVGQARQAIRGAHGLMIQPDLSLDQALSSSRDISNLFIIGDRGWPYRLGRDPRIGRLVDEVTKTGNTIILSDAVPEWPVNWQRIPEHQVRRYSPDHQLRQTMRGLCWEMQ